LIPYNPPTNIPILYTTTSSCTYRAYATTFEALKAPFFQWEKVFYFPGRGHNVNKPDLLPEEFVAEENVNVSASEGANGDNRMVKMANLLLPQQEESLKVTQQGPLTFNPSPPTKEARTYSSQPLTKRLSSCNGIALGHLTFPKLKQLALNGKILKKLAKVLPPKCAGCLFGTMTKLP
jgi:hypothetical protein